MTLIKIDGSQGEGGGQIFRTALSLSAITGKPFLIENIRAGRAKPGLLRQHLTCVQAAQAVCSARVTGAEISSASLRFEPGEIKAGSYDFTVGTAGSACLVTQTVLPILLNADKECGLTVSGGTHNSCAPTYDFFERVFMVVLRKLGVSIDAKRHQYGFYPAGGGSFSLSTKPWLTRNPAQFLSAGSVKKISAEVIFVKLPVHIAKRELQVLEQCVALKQSSHQFPSPEYAIHQVESRGPGNVVSILIERDQTESNVPELVTAFGTKGWPSEKVAQDAFEEAVAFIEADVPIGQHLADQLLLPLALAGGGAFRTGSLSEHTRTNIATIKAFLDINIKATPSSDGASTTIRISKD